MTALNRPRGFGTKEALLAIIVILIVAAILFPIFRRTQTNKLLLTESARMRQLYVNMYFYEQQYDNQPAPSLVALSLLDRNPADYLSSEDPFAGTKPGSAGFPADPGLASKETSPFRISFSYLQNFVRAKKISIKPWEEARMDPTLGVLGNEWLGSVNPADSFRADVSGQLLRINTDGSVYLLKDRGGPKPLGDPQDLFMKR